MDLKNGELEASLTGSIPDVSELLQLVSYVQLKDTAGSGGVILGPPKLFSPVFCRADYSAPFEHPRFALDLKNGKLEASLTGSVPTYQSYFS